MKKLVALLVAVSLSFSFVLAAAAPAGPPPGTTVERNLVFTQAGTKDLALDLYRPEKRSGNLPVLVWIYGGAWMSRNKEGQARNATWLATSGYAVAVIDYRLSSEGLFPAQINDCKAAVRWLRANAAKYGLDVEHFGAWGESSGGHLASLLGAAGGVKELEGDGGSADQSSRVQAVVDFFGPSDFLQMESHILTPTSMKHDPPTSPESRLVGGAIQENADKVARANPITYLSKEAPPFFIVHGDQDPLVPQHQSELMNEALKKAGVNVVFFKIIGAGHGGPAFHTVPVHGAVLAFLDQYLKPAGK